MISTGGLERRLVFSFALLGTLIAFSRAGEAQVTWFSESRTVNLDWWTTPTGGGTPTLQNRSGASAGDFAPFSYSQSLQGGGTPVIAGASQNSQFTSAGDELHLLATMSMETNDWTTPSGSHHGSASNNVTASFFVSAPTPYTITSSAPPFSYIGGSLSRQDGPSIAIPSGFGTNLSGTLEPGTWTFTYGGSVSQPTYPADFMVDFALIIPEPTASLLALPLAGPILFRGRRVDRAVRRSH